MRGSFLDSVTPLQADVWSRARDYAPTLAADAERRDAASAFPFAHMRELAALGLMGINIDPKWGGLGAGAVAYSLAVVELARACAGATVTLMVTNMVAEAIEKYGNEKQCERHVCGITSGAYPAGSFCLSEPGSGSDAAALRTMAKRNGDEYEIDGTKAWITSGPQAGVYLVTASSDPEARSRGITAFLLTRDDDGVSSGPPEIKMGQHTSATSSIHLDSVRVGADRVLGREGLGFTVAMNALDGGRIGVGSQGLGIGLSALDRATELLRSAGDLDDTARQRLGECRAELEAARQIVLRAAYLKDRAERRFTREASMAKLLCTEAGYRACVVALELAGRVAREASDSKLERCLRDARVTRIYEGTSEIQRLVMSREIVRGGMQ